MIPRMLGPQPHLAKHPVLAHRPGELCLDKAFALIEGHPGQLPVAGLSRADVTCALADGRLS